MRYAAVIRKPKAGSITEEREAAHTKTLRYSDVKRALDTEAADNYDFLICVQKRCQAATVFGLYAGSYTGSSTDLATMSQFADARAAGLKVQLGTGVRSKSLGAVGASTTNRLFDISMGSSSFTAICP